MIRMVIRTGLYISIPFMFAGIIVMAKMTYDAYKKKSLLSENGSNCITQHGLLVESSEGNTLEIQFSYNETQYIARASVKSDLLKKYYNKKVKFIFDRNDPSFNRIDIQPENEQFDQYLLGLIVSIVILVTMFIVILKSRRTPRKDIKQ